MEGIGMARSRSVTSGSPFGEASRVAILKEHLRAFGPITPASAWKFAYEELLWFDRSNNLVHLYESDKAQPGRSNWYQRSVTFTKRLGELFGVDKAGLKERIDRLFLSCLEKLVESREADASEAKALASAGAELGLSDVIIEEAEEEAAEAAEDADFVPYAELVAEVIELLVTKAGLSSPEAAELAKEIVDRAQFHLTFGSNRQNVLGEGFEDLLKLLAVEVAGVPEHRIIVRKKANMLPGFQGVPAQVRRIEKPDIAFAEGPRTQLISTVKWSLRHDRQKQLTDELDCYVQLLSQDSFPEYVLLTNEYDSGRLKNSAGLSSRGKTVDCIYHINPELVVEVLSDVPGSVDDVRKLITQGKLKSLEDFLNDLRAKYAAPANSTAVALDSAKPKRKKK
jgi:hypothetical protein